MLRKSQPNFYHYVKKIDAKAKKWFLIKRTCMVEQKGKTCCTAEKKPIKRTQF